jgi:pyrroline-5-carboxylate reductase
MPNTPALLRAGTLVFRWGVTRNRAHEGTGREDFVRAGTGLESPGNSNGRGDRPVGIWARLCFFLAECLASAGVSLGLAPPMAEALARQTLYGAGRMLAETMDPAGNCAVASRAPEAPRKRRFRF